MFKPPVIFTTFCGKGTNTSYISVPDAPTLKGVLDGKLQEYNESNAMMDLVLFDQAMVRQQAFDNNTLQPTVGEPLPCLFSSLTHAQGYHSLNVHPVSRRHVYFALHVNRWCATCSRTLSWLFRSQEHVTRICRIIQRPSGNAMLIGVGGSGKQSLSRLAAFICGFEIRQLSVTSKFKVSVRLFSSSRLAFSVCSTLLEDVEWVVQGCHPESLGADENINVYNLSSNKTYQRSTSYIGTITMHPNKAF